mmetsp:Transcript_34447/g.80552  ORF Transcript_34447/g.80552 Transcript_34447/m.80552 type:complete len:159 (-) Transcript_34447:312-788(-)
MVTQSRFLQVPAPPPPPSWKLRLRSLARDADTTSPPAMGASDCLDGTLSEAEDRESERGPPPGAAKETPQVVSVTSLTEGSIGASDWKEPELRTREAGRIESFPWDSELELMRDPLRKRSAKDVEVTTGGEEPQARCTPPVACKARLCRTTLWFDARL